MIVRSTPRFRLCNRDLRLVVEDEPEREALEPEDEWEADEPEDEWEADEPEDEWEADEPEDEWEADEPEDEWEADEPEDEEELLLDPPELESPDPACPEPDVREVASEELDPAPLLLWVSLPLAPGVILETESELESGGELELRDCDKLELSDPPPPESPDPAGGGESDAGEADDPVDTTTEEVPGESAVLVLGPLP